MDLDFAVAESRCVFAWSILEQFLLDEGAPAIVLVAARFLVINPPSGLSDAEIDKQRSLIDEALIRAIERTPPQT